MKNKYEKVLEFQQKVESIKKTEKNTFFKSNYFDINTLLKIIRPLLSELKLIILQPIKDGKIFTNIIDVDSGEIIESSFLVLPEKNNPQEIGSAITYYRRYLLTSLLAIESEDDDGNLASKTQDDRKWLNPNTPEWNEMEKYLENGGKITIESIKKKYKVSNETLEILKNKI